MKKLIFLSTIFILLGVHMNLQAQNNDKKILVAYFSATGNTRAVALHITDALKADNFEIKPVIPYTTADLNWRDNASRSSRENSDTSSRPEILGKVENMEQYNIIFLGYPSWWGQAPKIIYTFMESYNFSGKIIVPFITSGSSPIGTSAVNLHRLSSSNTTWLSGIRFTANASRSSIVTWLNGLALEITAR